MCTRARVLVHERRLHSPAVARHVRHFCALGTGRSLARARKLNETRRRSAIRVHVGPSPIVRRAAPGRPRSPLHLFYVTNVSATGDDDRAPTHTNINGKRERADRDDREIVGKDVQVLATVSEVVKSRDVVSFFRRTSRLEPVIVGSYI